MSKFYIYEDVKIVNSGDPNLDGISASVMGFYGVDKNNPTGIIILLKYSEVYDPCMVISPSCLVKVERQL